MGIHETAGGIVFGYASAAERLKVYCEGSLYGLREAYVRGILDEADLREIHEAFRTFRAFSYEG